MTAKVQQRKAIGPILAEIATSEAEDKGAEKGRISSIRLTALDYEKPLAPFRRSFFRRDWLSGKRRVEKHQASTRDPQHQAPRLALRMLSCTQQIVVRDVQRKGGKVRF